MPPAMITKAMPTAMIAMKLVSFASCARFCTLRNLFFTSKAGVRSPFSSTTNTRWRPPSSVRSNFGVRTVPLNTVNSTPSARMTSRRPLS